MVIGACLVAPFWVIVGVCCGHRVAANGENRGEGGGGDGVEQPARLIIASSPRRMVASGVSI